jgi:tRNA(Ile)-lysidine synthase
MATSRRLHPAYRSVRQSVRTGGLIHPGETVLVACSGGPDSTALLHVLLELSRDIPFGLAVAHFNHSLRPQAAADEQFVQDTALALEIPYLAGRGDVRSAARRMGTGIEEAGRVLRYEFLARAAAEVGAAKIATGHTMNDQAETVLMRILRGTGPAGLAGIPALRGGAIIRPLLETTRDEIMDYLGDRKLRWRTDASNRDEKIVRNKIRRRLIPYLEKNFSPAIIRSLARLAAISRDEDEELDRIAAAAFKRALLYEGGIPSLDAEALRKMRPTPSRRVVRLFLRTLKGDLRDISFDDVEAVRLLEDGGRLTIAKELVLERRHGRIGRCVRRSAAVPGYSLLWDGRGELPLDETGWTYRGRFAGLSAARAGLKSFSLKSGRRKSLAADDESGCLLDAGRISFPLLVRNRRPGDGYRPLGAPGRKKLKEILRAKGVSADERGRRPVFVSGQDIVWVQGLPVSEDYKITSATKKVLAISVAAREIGGGGGRE